MYDITRFQTFEVCKKWVDDVRQQAPEDAIIVLAGNKCDLEQLREVETRQGIQYSDKIGALFIETSAKSAVGIAELFDLLGTKILDKQKEVSKPKPTTASTDAHYDENVTSLDDHSQPSQSSGRKCCLGSG